MKKVLALLALIALAAAPALADRSMAGSTVTTDPMSVNVGTQPALTLYVYNGSVDTEWLASGFITLPSTLTFLSVDGYYCPDGAFDITIAGNTLSIADPDAGWGNLWDGSTMEIYVTIDVPTDADCGMLAIAWFLQGDIYGSEPHFVEGTTDFEVVCTTAVQSTDWSAVKAMY